MSIANLQEKLLFFTKQKSMLNQNLSNVQMLQISAARRAAQSQFAYNETYQELYYDPNVGYGTDDFTAWESQLEAQKEQLETQLNEVTQYESSWQKLLQQNIKNEFSYGGTGGGGK